MSIDHESTRNIVCPYCGYEDRDSWESGLHDGDQDTRECGRCERQFTASCEVSVTYTTAKIEPKP